MSVPRRIVEKRYAKQFEDERRKGKYRLRKQVFRQVPNGGVKVVAQGDFDVDMLIQI